MFSWVCVSCVFMWVCVCVCTCACVYQRSPTRGWRKKALNSICIVTTSLNVELCSLTALSISVYACVRACVCMCAVSVIILSFGFWFWCMYTLPLATQDWQAEKSLVSVAVSQTTQLKWGSHSGSHYKRKVVFLFFFGHFFFSLFF